jgi:hypothetical protein
MNIGHNLPRPRTIDECLYPSRGLAHDYDAEMDNPEPTDPIVKAELEWLQTHKMERSPAQNVEWALMEWEKNYIASTAQRWPGQDRWQGRENEDMRVVNIMHPHKFMRRLQRAGVDARIHDDHYGRLWLNDFTRSGRIGIGAWVKGRVKHITTLQYPCGPEYTVMRFNDYNVPTTEKYRGWRTALLALIMENVITEEEADRAFGPPLGEAASFYRQQLQSIRGYRMGLKI